MSAPAVNASHATQMLVTLGLLIVIENSANLIFGGDLRSGYYQLYFLVVLLEFYAVFPLLLILLRRTAGHHGLLLAVSGALQVLIVSLMHWCDA